MKKKKLKTKSKKTFFQSPIWLGIVGLVPVIIVMTIFGVNFVKSGSNRNDLLLGFNMNDGKSYLDLSEIAWEMGDRGLSAEIYGQWADQINKGRKQSVVLGVWDNREISLSEYKELRIKLDEIKSLSYVIKSRFLLEKEASILEKLGFSNDKEMKILEAHKIDSVDKLN